VPGTGTLFYTRNKLQLQECAMFEGRAVGAMTLVAALMTGTASMALTTDEVWADWQAVMVEVGATVSAATEVKDGKDLRLNGVTIAYDDGARVTMAELMLTAEDDGSVTIVPLDIAVTAAEGTKIGIAQEGLMVIVHDDPGGIGYGIMADMVEVTFDAASPDTGARNSGKVRVDALDGRYERTEGSALMNLTATEMAYGVTSVDPSLSIDQIQAAFAKDLEINSEMTVPEGVDLTRIETPEAFGAAVKSGLAFVAEISQGASESRIEDRGRMFPFSAIITANGGSTGVDLGADGIMFGGTAQGLGFVVPPGAMPAEISGSLDEMTFEFGMPVIASEEPGDYVAQMALKNVVLADAGWALIDPTGALPRTPADLEIDLGGTARIDLIALMASAETGQAPTTMPELLTMDIRAMTLKLAGAAFMGTGAFTFDNSMVAMGGPPMPVGTASVRLEGANRMIDALTAMGVLNSQDAMGARALMGAFGRPAGDDVLTSEIEARQGGSIFVNGQQVQ
jgi:hypothetical protein